MALKSGAKNKKSEGLKPLQKLSLWSYSHPRKTALLWMIVMLFGISCYSVLLKREGFPAINPPLSIISGTYLVNDSAKVDKEVASPISKIAKENASTKNADSQSFPNFYNVIVTYKDGTDAKKLAPTLSNRSSSKMSCHRQQLYKSNLLNSDLLHVAMI